MFEKSSTAFNVYNVYYRAIQVFLRKYVRIEQLPNKVLLLNKVPLRKELIPKLFVVIFLLFTKQLQVAAQ